MSNFTTGKIWERKAREEKSMTKLGERIKRIRELKGLNQKKIAVRMNISSQTYAVLEEAKNLKYSTVKKFCEAIEIDPSFLLAEDVPISEETIQFFDGMRGKPFLLCHEQLR
ncbi:MAG: helix-turn-helix transcriptional regulator, partial [Bacteroidota bacterium]